MSGVRTRSARETYVEHLQYGQGLTPYANKKTRSFTHLKSFDDGDLPYRSTPEYLRQLLHAAALAAASSPNEQQQLMMLAGSHVARTKSASELTPRNNNLNRPSSGNPKYKTQEEYYEDVQAMKKQMKTMKEENSNMRAKIRRLEEENARKLREIDNLYDTNKDGDLRRTLTGPATDRSSNNQNTSSTSASNVVMSLKQRVFKLELQLKEKETIIDEMKFDPRWTKGTEMEIQNRAFRDELARIKVERANLIHSDYTSTLNEEMTNAIHKYQSENAELKTLNTELNKKVHELESHKETRGTLHELEAENTKLEKENQRLHKKVKELESEIDDRRPSSRQSKSHRDDSSERELRDKIKRLERERDQWHGQFDDAIEELAQLKRERDRQAKAHPSSSARLDHETLRASNTSLRGKKPVTPLKTSARSQRGDEWGSDHNRRVKDFRQKRAATVIQRQWRHYDKTRKAVLRDFGKERQSNLDKWSSKVGPAKTSGTQSPRGSQLKLGSKVDNLGSGTIKNRPSSGSAANESALKIVQASLRGQLRRSDMEKMPQETPARSPSPPLKPRTPPKTQKPPMIDSDDDDIVSASMERPSSPVKRLGSQHGSETKRSDIFDRPKPNTNQTALSNSKQNLHRQSPPPLPLSSSKQTFGSGAVGDKRHGSPLPMNDREPVSKLRRTPSPTFDNRPSSPRPGSGGGAFKAPLPTDKSKLGSSGRLAANDREPASKLHRTPSPTFDNRPSSPRPGSGGGAFKAPLPTDKSKLGSGGRLATNDREPASKLHRTPSPTFDNRPSSPRPGSGGGASKAALPTDKSKLGSSGRLGTNDREPVSKLRHTPSPPPPYRQPEPPKISGDRPLSRPGTPEPPPRSTARQNVPQVRKSPTNSKRSVNNDDDDDVMGF